MKSALTSREAFPHYREVFFEKYREGAVAYRPAQFFFVNSALVNALSERMPEEDFPPSPESFRAVSTNLARNIGDGDVEGVPDALARCRDDAESLCLIIADAMVFSLFENYPEHVVEYVTDFVKSGFITTENLAQYFE